MSIFPPGKTYSSWVNWRHERTQTANYFWESLCISTNTVYAMQYAHGCFIVLFVQFGSRRAP